MNGLERVKAAIRLEKTDRTPAVPQVFGHAAVVAGTALPDYLRDGALMARCQAQALARYGYDAVFAFADLCVETEALGSTVKYYPAQYPEVIAYALSPASEPGVLGLPDPRAAGRMPEVLKAVSALRREVGEEVAVCGGLAGPMTVATQLLGIEAALYLAIDDPGRFERLLDFTAEVAVRYGVAQVEAGAHIVMMMDPSASPAVVPPAFFRELVLPRVKKVFSACRKAGAVATWLNIAGPTQGILPYYPEAGADIANFDYYVDPATARALLPATCLDGNMKSLSFIYATPAEVAAEAAALCRAFADRGGFLLSSGCEIPPEAAPETIAALVAAARAGD